MVFAHPPKKIFLRDIKPHLRYVSTIACPEFEERKKEREREVSRGLTAHKVWGDVAAMSIKEDLQEEGDAEGLLGAQ